MAGSLFRTKSIDRLLADAAASGEARSSARSARGPWSRSASAPSSAPACSSAPPRPSPTAPARRSSLAFIVAGVGCAFAGLCYAEFASMIPDRRQRLHLLLRHHGRAGRLDHRLGPRARVRRRRRHRRRSPGARYVNRVLDFGSGCRSRTQWTPFAVRERRPTASHGIINLPAVVILAAAHRAADPRHAGVGLRQRAHRRHQGQRSC